PSRRHPDACGHRELWYLHPPAPHDDRRWPDHTRSGAPGVENPHRLRNRSAHQQPIVGGVRLSGTQTMVGLRTLSDQTAERLRWMVLALAAIHEANPAVPGLLACTTSLPRAWRVSVLSSAASASLNA